MDNFLRKEYNLNYLPYPVQVTLVEKLEGSADALLNLLSVFPGGDLEREAGFSRGKWLFQKLLPLLLPYLPLKDTLNCRLVCALWRATVDHLLENVGLPEHHDYSQRVHRTPVWRGRSNWRTDPFYDTYAWEAAWIIRRNVFGVNDVVLHRFMEEVELNPWSPFPFRTVIINHQNRPEYWDNMTRFLERFGHHVWKLEVRCFFQRHHATLILRDFLKHTPNLRMLNINFHNSRLPTLLDEEKEELARNLSQNGFPALPHLTCLDWTFNGLFYRWALPRYSDQLVQVVAMSFLRWYDSRKHGSFPNLKLLDVMVGTPEDLQKLGHLKCALRSLTVRFLFRHPLNKCLSVVRTFSPTLEYLCLSSKVRYAEGYPKSRSLRLFGRDKPWQFPKLVTIRMENPNPMESLDGLLRIQPGPKMLQIQTDRTLAYKMPDEQVQIHGFLENMYESQIWERMTRLEVVKVELGARDGRPDKRVYMRRADRKDKASESQKLPHEEDEVKVEEEDEWYPEIYPSESGKRNWCNIM